MSYLSLLFPSATQGKTKSQLGCVGAARHELLTQPCSLAAAEIEQTGTGDYRDDFQLPTGIASLEHWLDLNA